MLHSLYCFLSRWKSCPLEKKVNTGVANPIEIYLFGKQLHIYYKFHFLICHAVALYGKQTCYLYYLDFFEEIRFWDTLSLAD